MANRFLNSLISLVSDSGQNFYFASPGFSTGYAITGGAAATAVTVPTGYGGAAISAGGALYYVNHNGAVSLGGAAATKTATGVASVGTTGVTDLECPSQLSLTDQNAQPITALSIYAPVTCTVFIRWFK